jgi:hypothetical protein
LCDPKNEFVENGAFRGIWGHDHSPADQITTFSQRIELRFVTQRPQLDARRDLSRPH